MHQSSCSLASIKKAAANTVVVVNKFGMNEWMIQGMFELTYLTLSTNYWYKHLPDFLEELMKQPTEIAYEKS